MGVNLRDLLIKEEITLEQLKGRTIAIDSFNIIFQFLTTIRSPDGNLLTNKEGKITSHIIGLFSRTSKFLEMGIKPIFVFDGEPPELKKTEIQRRKRTKQEASEKLEQARKEEDTELIQKYSARTSTLNQEMIDSAKKLIELMGLPTIQAPSEGEAQASYLVKKGDAWAISSQDYDSLLYGANNLIQNLSIAGKRKKNRTLGYTTVKPELINLKKNLENLGINQEQLIATAMMVGTDYNYGGIKGIGPKNALKLAKKHKNLDELFKEAKWNEQFDFSWQEVYELFTKMPINQDYTIKFKEINEEKLTEYLVEQNDFSLERVKSTIEKIKQANKEQKQKTLGEF